MLGVAEGVNGVKTATGTDVNGTGPKIDPLKEQQIQKIINDPKLTQDQKVSAIMDSTSLSAADKKSAINSLIAASTKAIQDQLTALQKRYDDLDARMKKLEGNPQGNQVSGVGSGTPSPVGTGGTNTGAAGPQAPGAGGGANTAKEGPVASADFYEAFRNVVPDKTFDTFQDEVSRGALKGDELSDKTTKISVALAQKGYSPDAISKCIHDYIGVHMNSAPSPAPAPYFNGENYQGNGGGNSGQGGGWGSPGGNNYNGQVVGGQGGQTQQYVSTERFQVEAFKSAFPTMTYDQVQSAYSEITNGMNTHASQFMEEFKTRMADANMSAEDKQRLFDRFSNDMLKFDRDISKDKLDFLKKYLTIQASMIRYQDKVNGQVLLIHTKGQVAEDKAWSNAEIKWLLNEQKRDTTIINSSTKAAAKFAGKGDFKGALGAMAFGWIGTLIPTTATPFPGRRKDRHRP